MMYTRGAAAAACVLWLAIGAQAHHSHGNYKATFIDLEGIVREVHLVNPHSWVYLEVKGPDVKPGVWALEATSRVALERAGVTATIKTGDRIKVRCHPLRDDSRGCLLGFVKTADGVVKDWDVSNLPVPGDL
jgi:hypothetical protein